MQARNTCATVTLAISDDLSFAIEDLVGQGISAEDFCHPLPTYLRDQLNLDEPKPAVTVQLRELAVAKKKLSGN